MRNFIRKAVGYASLAFAFAIAFVSNTSVTLAAYNWNFASSSEETNALTAELAQNGLLIFFGGVGLLLGVALIMLGAGWVWGRFKKFTGMRKKL